MGYSRADSLSLRRAWKPQTLSGSVSAASTVGHHAACYAIVVRTLRQYVYSCDYAA